MMPEGTTERAASAPEEAYRETLTYLFRLHRVGIKLGLDNIRALLDFVGNPQEHFPAIHIAGTNGKGSTAAIIESILLSAGYKTALYTSPHLVDFRERIRVNRQEISVAEVVEFTRRVRPLVEKIQPSFFEVTTAMAFEHFARQAVDVAVIETGMGGRLDSTNVVHPLITLITPIDFDHQNYLGGSLGEIAFEKAGIIKPGVPCLTNNRNPEVLAVLREQCEAKNSPFIDVAEESACQLKHTGGNGSRFEFRNAMWEFDDLYLNLAGEYQLENARLALCALARLPDRLSVDAPSVRKGLASVEWRGRLHRVSTKPDIFVDVSHNPGGVARTLAFLHRFYPPEQINVITFLQEDKDYREIARLLGKGCHQCWVVDLPLGKPLPAETYTGALRQHGSPAAILKSIEEAERMIQQRRDDGTVWVIIGSHYLAGEFYKRNRNAE